MSISIYVAFNRERLPSAASWAERIRIENFDVELNKEFDPAFFSGFLPCPDESAGFEYSIGSLASELSTMNLRPEQQKQLGSANAVVELSFRTEGDLRVALAVSAVLASMTGGHVLDGESGILMTAEKSLAWARGTYLPRREASGIGHPSAKPNWSALRITRFALMGALIVWLGYQWATK